jgi:hypothetical protein
MTGILDDGCPTRHNPSTRVVQKRKGETATVVQGGTEEEATATTMVRSISEDDCQMFTELAVVGTVGIGVTAVIAAVMPCVAVVTWVVCLPFTLLGDGLEHLAAGLDEGGGAGRGEL